jgi:hypothetical protein
MNARVFGLIDGVVLSTLLACSALQAQSTTMPSTLRYGSGLLDVPVAGVLPHLGVATSFSGFFVSLQQTSEVDGSGDPAGFGPGSEQFYGDASLTLGLFDRVEVGTTIQALGEESDGGSMWGLFGRVQLLRPSDEGLGLAVGARYVGAPSFGDGSTYRPGRLGFPDRRLRDGYSGKSDLGTDLSVYGVASVNVAGFSGGWLPDHAMTLSLGYGSGMFKDGGQFDFYKTTDSNGWFAGSALHIGLGDAAVVTFMSEYNGFDVNLGAQMDIRGVRLGAHVLGVNHAEPQEGYASEYRSPKFGIMASVALCLGSRSTCKPRLTERSLPDTIWIPPPPPDTVILIRDGVPPAVDGAAHGLCLADGSSVRVRVTEEGDTLVGPDGASLRSLRPGLVASGAYASEAEWLLDRRPIDFGGRTFVPGANERLDSCIGVQRVGEHRGVPVFSPRPQAEVPSTLLVPVTPGIWRVYRIESGRRGGRVEKRSERAPIPAGRAGAGEDLSCGPGRNCPNVKAPPRPIH